MSVETRIEDVPVEEDGSDGKITPQFESVFNCRPSVLLAKDPKCFTIKCWQCVTCQKCVACNAVPVSDVNELPRIKMRGIVNESSCFVL